MDPRFQFEFSTSLQTGALVGNAEFFKELLETLWFAREMAKENGTDTPQHEVDLSKRLADELSKLPTPLPPLDRMRLDYPSIPEWSLAQQRMRMRNSQMAESLLEGPHDLPDSSAKAWDGKVSFVDQDVKKHLMANSGLHGEDCSICYPSKEIPCPKD